MDEYERGFKDGLDAARDAVEALITKFHPIGASGPCVCHGGEWRSLAAIDGVKP